MRIERYYASLREEVSPLVEPAQELLNRQDYVGFFKACGPNYIRGIRRAQEVTAMFSFKSSDVETASQYASNVQVKLADYGISRACLPTGTKGFGGTEGFMAPEIMKACGLPSGWAARLWS